VLLESTKDPKTAYPADLTRDITTTAGTKLHVRPIRPDDADRLVTFHGELSPGSVYRRYFFVHPRLSALEVERFTCVDYVDRLALVAEDDERLVAVGRYDRRPGTGEAEVAFVVADRYQHHGVGALLLDLLADAAWRRGVTEFVASTLTENRDMLGLFAASGFKVSTTREGDTVDVRFPIEPDDAYRASLRTRRTQTQDRARHVD
jgi:GNAT superfamily N-acetyltransferase